MPWTVVIPLKPPGIGKTRLGADAALARAIALDTVEAASHADRVERVIVVTADQTMTAELDAMAGVEVVVEPRPAGIAAALALGLATAGEGARAALLGDLPGLVPEELDAVLEQAEASERAFVRDAEGSGTTLVTARSGVEFVERFGPGSAEAHRAAGLVELDVSALSSVRHDVDDAGQLEALALRGLGPRTSARLEG